VEIGVKMLSLQAKLELKNLLKSTNHSLTVDDFDDIVKLDKLCKAITDNDAPINDIVDMPVVIGGYQLKQPSIGVLEWYNEWYLPMFDHSALMCDAGLAYALSLSDTPDELWKINSKVRAWWRITLFKRKLGCTHEELRVVLKKLLNISDDENNDEQSDTEEDEPANTGKLIAILCKEYGHTAPYWLWEAPIGLINTFLYDYNARIEAETENIRNASLGSNKPPPTKSRAMKFKKLREHKATMRDKWQKMQK